MNHYIEVSHALQHLFAIQNDFLHIFFVPLDLVLLDETGKR